MPSQYRPAGWDPTFPDNAHAVADQGDLAYLTTRRGALLVDLGCGAGLLAPHLAGKGYRHVGVDLTASALARLPCTVTAAGIASQPSGQQQQVVHQQILAFARMLLAGHG